MFDSLKRVISNPDEIGSKESSKISKIDQQDDNSTTEEGATGTDVYGKPTISCADDEQQPTKPPAVVEYDDSDIFVETTIPTRTTDRNIVSTSIASGSTLSDGVNDDSIHVEQIQQQQKQQQQQQQQHLFVPRSRINIEPLKDGRNSNNNNSNNRMARPSSQLSTDSYGTKNSIGASSSRDASGNWGWFEDVHGIGGSTTDLQKIITSIEQAGNDISGINGINNTNRLSDSRYGGVKITEEAEVLGRIDDNEAAAMAVTAPTYVLEESLSSQKLWKDTAGNRPPQPVEERAFYEKMWAQNFARSQVDYQAPIEVLTASSPVSLSPFADGGYGDDGAHSRDGGPHGVLYSDQHHGAIMAPKKGDLYGVSNKTSDMAEAALMYRLQGTTTRSDGAMADFSGKRKVVKGSDSEGDLFEILKGENVFGTTVSKSFPRSNEYGAPISGVDTINISIASYRVVESKRLGKYAQFLVIYREGSIRDTVGVWKRFSDFVDLSKKVTASQEGCSSVLATMSPLHITEEHEHEHLPNAITSWSLIKKRQKWLRCLEPGYLSLKVFLLERFLHDILFECSTPKLLRAFALDPQSLRD